MKIVVVLISCLSIINMNAQDLQKHQWKDRIIVVKATDIASEKLQAQLKQFEDSSEEMIERKLVVYLVTEADFTFINYKNKAFNREGKVSGKLAKILNSKEDFEVLLIGLDGGIKLRQTDILTKEKLFSLVDAMPMRSNELRGN